MTNASRAAHVVMLAQVTAQAAQVVIVQQHLDGGGALFGGWRGHGGHIDPGGRRRIDRLFGGERRGGGKGRGHQGQDRGEDRTQGQAGGSYRARTARALG